MDHRIMLITRGKISLFSLLVFWQMNLSLVYLPIGTIIVMATNFSIKDDKVSILPTFDSQALQHRVPVACRFSTEKKKCHSTVYTCGHTCTMNKRGPESAPGPQAKCMSWLTSVQLNPLLLPQTRCFHPHCLLDHFLAQTIQQFRVGPSLGIWYLSQPQP